MNTTGDVHGLRPAATEWYKPAMRIALAARDFTTVYNRLMRIGCSQNHIASLTGQFQPEISAICHGRRVMAYDLMDEIVTGLGIPRCLTGMATCCHQRCADHPGADSTPIALARYPTTDHGPSGARVLG